MNADPGTTGPAAFAAVPAVVRVRASYLLGRWSQAPISDRREADP